MKKDRYYLDYVDENGEIRKELKDAVNNIKKKDFKINDFYRILNNIIMHIYNNELDDIFHRLVSIKPDYKIGTIYYLMSEFSNKKDKDLLELGKYKEDDIELFMIVNFLRKM